MASSTWLPLLVAALGIAGTVTGVVLTQRNANHRDDITWARERERERQAWEREDLARTFDDRRVAYVEFFIAVKALAKMAYDRDCGLTEGAELPGDWDKDAAEKLRRLEFWADPMVTLAATDAYRAAWSWGTEGKYIDPDDPDSYDREDEYGKAELRMTLLMRKSLLIPRCTGCGRDLCRSILGEAQAPGSSASSGGYRTPLTVGLQPGRSVDGAVAHPGRGDRDGQAAHSSAEDRTG
jgi:hypothetical protein